MPKAEGQSQHVKAELAEKRNQVNLLLAEFAEITRLLRPEA